MMCEARQTLNGLIATHIINAFFISINKLALMVLDGYINLAVGLLGRDRHVDLKAYSLLCEQNTAVDRLIAQ